MQITYELTQRDFFESFTAHYHSKKLLKWGYRVLITVFSILVGLSLFGAARRLSTWTLSGLLEPLGLVGYLCLSMWGYPWWLARTQFQKQPSVQGQRRALLDHDGIQQRWDGGSGLVEWKNVPSVNSWLAGRIRTPTQKFSAFKPPGSTAPKTPSPCNLEQASIFL